MDNRAIGVGEVTAATLTLLREHAGISLAVTLAIAVGYSLLDLMEAPASNTIATVAVSVFGQYLFTEQLLSHRMPAPLPARRYGALFLAGLISGLGMVLGTILLILPGIFLVVRWSIITPFVVAEGMSATEALKASWQATAKSWPALFGVVLLAGVILVAGLAGIFFAGETYGLGDTSLPVVVPTNLLVGAMTVVAWLFAVAVYQLVVSDDGATSQVFA